MVKRELNIGTMNSSKSAQLIMKVYNLTRQGKYVAPFKPETDQRDGSYIASRALETKIPAMVVPKHSDGREFSLGISLKTKKPDVIVVDELQFFTPQQIEELAKVSVDYNIDVYAYGLMISYTGEMFETTKRAIECGFTVKSIDMSCDFCNNDATHHLLYINNEIQLDGSGIAVEDKENNDQVYHSVCYPCFTKATINENNEEEKQ